MKPNSGSRKCDLESLAYVGALPGVLVAGTHQMYSIYMGDFHSDDPFTHMMVELFGAALGGSLLFCAVGWIRNQNVAKQERTSHKAPSKPET
ncbi:hypothetical protein JKG68_10460 [Microvirga aerilata]|uniref:Uncharacterized protein n=1 Tax=Microvirga aerilata TaxID=670292 RepID=A0A936Z8A9_9HYPH|nr:hypothetical protein [Microvirga aerilata]MBL0404392.1 hypothetical protein [Microvirga aerilata]